MSKSDPEAFSVAYAGVRYGEKDLPVTTARPLHRKGVYWVLYHNAPIFPTLESLRDQLGMDKENFALAGLETGGLCRFSGKRWGHIKSEDGSFYLELTASNPNFGRLIRSQAGSSRASLPDLYTAGNLGLYSEPIGTLFARHFRGRAPAQGSEYQDLLASIKNSGRSALKLRFKASASAPEGFILESAQVVYGSGPSVSVRVISPSQD